jgi:hypothetical protein
MQVNLCPAWSLCWRRNNKKKLAKAKKEKWKRQKQRLLHGTVPRRRESLSQCLDTVVNDAGDMKKNSSTTKCTCALNSGGKWVTDMNKLKELGHATGEGSQIRREGGACIIPRDEKEQEKNIKKAQGSIPCCERGDDQCTGSPCSTPLPRGRSTPLPVDSSPAAMVLTEDNKVKPAACDAECHTAEVDDCIARHSPSYCAQNPPRYPAGRRRENLGGEWDGFGSWSSVSNPD